MAEIQTTQSVTTQAPLESSIATSHQVTDIVHRVYTKKVTIGEAVLRFVIDSLPGCGRINLVKIVAVFVCPAEDLCVKIGVCSTGQSLTATQAAMKENGVYFVSSVPTRGVRHVTTIIPEDTLSRQLQPTSSQLPTTKLLIEISEGVVLSLQFHIQVEGMRQHFSQN